MSERPCWCRQRAGHRAGGLRIGGDVLIEGNETLGFVSTLLVKGTAGLIASSVVMLD